MSDDESDHKSLATPTVLNQGDHYEVVEVLNPEEFDRIDDEEGESNEKEEMPVYDSHNIKSEPSSSKHFTELDLVDFTLVRCGEDSETGRPQYRLVAADSAGSDEGALIDSDAVCVLDNSEMKHEQGGSGTEYMSVVEGVEGVDAEPEPLVIIEYPEGKKEQVEDTSPSLLAKVIYDNVAGNTSASGHAARKPKMRHRTTLPPTHVMLSSPNFRLFLYSCTQCNFKCNAMQELTLHKKEKHVGRSAGRWKSNATNPRGPSATLQCARCPYRALTNAVLLNHMEREHTVIKRWRHTSKQQEQNKSTTQAAFEPAVIKIEENILDLLVCAACGFESKDRAFFRKHVHKHKRLAK